MVQDKIDKKWEKSLGLYFLNRPFPYQTLNKMNENDEEISKEKLENKIKEVHELQKELKISSYCEFSDNLELKIIQVQNSLKSLRNIKETRHNNKLRKEGFKIKN